jgi:hypothetical protein
LVFGISFLKFSAFGRDHKGPAICTRFFCFVTPSETLVILSAVEGRGAFSETKKSLNNANIPHANNQLSILKFSRTMLPIHPSVRSH